MKFLQKLGKALMLPVACLPICGILMGIGYALCPATMQGGDITGIGNQIGFFLVKAGGALIDNMALLFVIGVGVGMSDKHDGTGGLAALASWLMITTLLSTAVVTTIMPSIAKNADATLAFDKIGLGDLTHFWAGETSKNVSWSLGMYMSGFFPCMMFGIPGAALAMIQTAKSNKKKIAIGLVGSAAVCAFVCGVTEPFEFGFMFLAPGLYVIYALLYGIFTTITTLVGFRAGFSFSAGATDLVFSSSLPAAQKTWMIIPLGIAAFIVFYVVFRIAITKFDLKTPGREDDDIDEENIALANDDYTAMASVILEGLGGSANVKSVDNCITRLRLEINDDDKVNEAKIKSSGAAGIIRPGKGNIQVIIGPKVQFVADEMEKLCK